MSDRDSVVTVDELDDFDGDAGDDGMADSRTDWMEEGGRAERRAESPAARREHQRSAAPGGELCTKILYIQSKKFFIDIKETRRGLILKLSEIQLNGSRSRMTMEMGVVSELHEKLTEFIEQYAALGPRSDNPNPNIRSESIRTKERRYYLDLKENRRGRFLKISMIMGPPTYERAEIVIPAQGMVDLRDVLTDLLSEYGKGETEAGTAREEEKREGERREERREERVRQHEEPESRDRREEASALKEEEGLALKVQDKTYYAAVVRRRHGVFLRISEVKPSYRTAVNVPHDHWERFLDVLKRNASELTNHTSAGDAVQPNESATADDDDVIWTGTE